MTRRRRDLEDILLKSGEARVGLQNSGYRDRVMSRLDGMSRMKGEESALAYGPARMAREIDYEALDLGGWSALFYEQTFIRRVEVRDMDRVRLLLAKLAGLGARAGDITKELLDLCDE